MGLESSFVVWKSRKAVWIARIGHTYPELFSVGVFYTLEGCFVYFFRLLCYVNEISLNDAFCSESLRSKQPVYNLTSSVSLRQ